MRPKIDSLGYGIVGYGRVSQRHLYAVKDIPELSLRAICDSDPNRLLQASRDDPSAHCYSDYRELLERVDIDLISICTPSGLHAEMAIAAARARKHVILEKPIALSMRDAQRIARAFSASGTSFCVMLQNRLNPAITFLRERLARLGSIRYAAASVFWYRDQEYYNDSWHGTKRLDGGILMNQGTHYFDILLYLTSKCPKKVSAFGGTYAHSVECEDAASVNILFTDGTIANVQANSFSYPENFEGSLTLFFERATIKIGGKSLNHIEYWRGADEEEAMEWKNLASHNYNGDTYKTIFKNVYSHIQFGSPLLIPGAEGLRSLRVITAAYSSLKAGRAIAIK